MNFRKAVDECARVNGRSIPDGKTEGIDPKYVKAKPACRSSTWEIGRNSISDALQRMRRIQNIPSTDNAKIMKSTRALHAMEDVEDPGVVDARICSGKIRQ